jgi:hypothetical protein
MHGKFTVRSLIAWALLAVSSAGLSGIVSAQRGTQMSRPSASFTRLAARPSAVGGQEQQPAPIERRPPLATQPEGGTAEPRMVGPNPLRGNGPKGEHLAEWMNQHSTLTLEQQQRALGREPGFGELSAATQQRMRERLTQLNAMSPQQRERLLAHNEAIERLNPDQRAQVRGAMQQLGALPPDQRREVARSFRQLRELLPNQRMAAMRGPQYGWLNGQQRSTLTHLIQVEPMLPTE